MQASSRNKQLGCYTGNWATIEIMKTLLKNWHSYQTRIRLLDVVDSDIKSEDKREDDEWEKMYMNDNRGNKEEDGSSVNGDGEEDGEEEEEESEGKDDGDGEVVEESEGKNDGNDSNHQKSQLFTLIIYDFLHLNSLENPL